MVICIRHIEYKLIPKISYRNGVTNDFGVQLLQWNKKLYIRILADNDRENCLYPIHQSTNPRTKLDT